MISKGTLGKISVVVVVVVPGVLLIAVSHDDFAVSGESGLNIIFRVPVYGQVLALILVVLAVSGCVFYDKAPPWLVFALMVAVACYALGLHNLNASWTQHELVDQYWPVYARRLSIVPSSPSVLGVTCSRGAFVARFTNEKKEGMNVFLGIYPWRIDRDRFDKFFACESKK